MTRHAPCGSWPSPITAAALTAAQIGISEPRFDTPDICWLESRPSERGRNVLMAAGGDSAPREVLPPTFNVRTRVHEYGGGAWLRRGGTVIFSDFPSQRMFRMDADGAPRPLTPEPAARFALRYADADLSPDGKWIVTVRETHASDGQVTNDIAVLRADGSDVPRSLVSGHDFFSCPRFSPDGSRLAWTTWDHPRMPWDGTDLWVATFESGEIYKPARHLAGGPAESIFQPAWQGPNTLWFVSDRTGWGNLYRVDLARGVEPAPLGSPVPVCPMDAEFGAPQWVFGLSRYALLGGGRIAAIASRDGEDRLGLVDVERRRFEPWDCGYTSLYAIASDGRDRVAVIGGAPDRVMELSVGTAGSDLAVVRPTLELPPDPAYHSVPRHIAFPTSGGEKAYAFYYPPAHPDVGPMRDEAPPLIVTSHGGPTTATRPTLNLAIQFWTSRGFGVVDVNYRGSTGYGRPYMDSLKGRWGEADVDDSVAAARYLAAQGEVDPGRMVIRGKSASGLTTLAALVFHDVFRAGASYYGVADLEGLARDTHKFESRYLDSLIGAYPEARDLYRSRSPLEHAEDLVTPVIFFQGLEDVVVPPSQPEAMIRVLEEKNLPYAYLTFEGEQHGFRQAATVERALEAELYFYGRILGFVPADPIEPVSIAHLDSG